MDSGSEKDIDQKFDSVKTNNLVWTDSNREQIIWCKDAIKIDL